MRVDFGCFEGERGCDVGGYLCCDLMTTLTFVSPDEASASTGGWGRD